ncbi:hypothetical protein GGI20_002868 [Coemansia sp. BCRC 34301]|nr:hypothetical protein GGI20_002868 [Coemansia sp. BCRC 34301]
MSRAAEKQRVSRFLQDIRADTARPAFSVNLVMAVTGFGAWRSKLPNADALHGLAVWEIYRARTELSLDSVMHSGEAMFLRWQSTVMLRIVHDYTYSFSRLKAGQPFHKRWLQVSNRWYHFDPGEDEDSGKLTFRNSNYPLDSRLHYFLHPSTATDADTSSALSTTTISDPPPNARDPVG